MTNLHETIGDVQDAESAAQAEARSARNQAASNIEKLQASISKGSETTGNELHDGLIVLYGKDLLDSPQIVENYENVAQQLEGKSGEPVVLIHRWTEKEGCSSFGGRLRTALHRSVSVGVLNDDELLFDYSGQTCRLPTERYAIKGSRSPRREPRVKDGQLEVASTRGFSHPHLDLGYDMGRKISKTGLGELQTMIYERQEIRAATLAIGHEGIKKWLARGTEPLNSINAEMAEARELCEALEIPPITPVTDEQRRYLGHIAI